MMPAWSLLVELHMSATAMGSSSFLPRFEPSKYLDLDQGGDYSKGGGLIVYFLCGPLFGLFCQVFSLALFTIHLF